jgi:hypothetical protein
MPADSGCMLRAPHISVVAHRGSLELHGLIAQSAGHYTAAQDLRRYAESTAGSGSIDPRLKIGHRHGLAEPGPTAADLLSGARIEVFICVQRGATGTFWTTRGRLACQLQP